MPKMGQKHFHFNPSRAPVRNIFAFRGEATHPLARKLSPRREHRVPAFSQLSASTSSTTATTAARKNTVYGAK